MFNKIYDSIEDKYQYRKFYNLWVENIRTGFEVFSRNIDSVYEIKHDLSPEMAQIFVSCLMDFYTQLKFSYIVYVDSYPDQTSEERKHNYNAIQIEVDNLLNQYKKMIKFIISFSDLSVYENTLEKIPNEFFIYDDFI